MFVYCVFNVFQVSESKDFEGEDFDLNAKHNAVRHMPKKPTSVFMLVSDVKT